MHITIFNNHIFCQYNPFTLGPLSLGKLLVCEYWENFLYMRNLKKPSATLYGVWLMLKYVELRIIDMWKQPSAYYYWMCAAVLYDKLMVWMVNLDIYVYHNMNLRTICASWQWTAVAMVYQKYDRKIAILIELTCYLVKLKNKEKPFRAWCVHMQEARDR